MTKEYTNLICPVCFARKNKILLISKYNFGVQLQIECKECKQIFYVSW